MLIWANCFPERERPFWRTDWERADFWTNRSYRPFVTDARASASLLYAYLASYRQRENVALKSKFWKLYLQFVDALGRLYNVPTQRNRQREEPSQTFGQLTFLNLRLTPTEMETMDATKVTPAGNGEGRRPWKGGALDVAWSCDSLKAI